MFLRKAICFDKVWVVFARKTLGFDGKPWVLMRIHAWVMRMPPWFL